MYLRSAFTETDPARIRALIRDHHFGLLVTHGPRGSEASHIPFTLAESGGGFTLMGHLAAANPQCDTLAGPALAVFSGPHAYISPSWYAVQPAVPTWDYAAVHVYGRLEALSDPSEIMAGLQDLSAADPGGFRVEAMPPRFRKRMLAGIRAFRLVPERVEAQWKMSQNRATADRRGVVAALRMQDETEVASLVAATLPAGEA